VRLIAVEGELVAELGLLIRRFFGKGLTFVLGYSNGEGLYLPTSAMLEEGGYEVASYWEYGFPAPLAPGIEETLTRGSSGCAPAASTDTRQGLQRAICYNHNPTRRPGSLTGRRHGG